MTEEQRKSAEQMLNAVLDSNEILDADVREKLDVAHKALVDFLDVNKGATVKEDADIDTLYSEYKVLIMAYISALKATQYKFTLTQDEFKFIKDVILRKGKFDRTDVYVALRAKNEFLDLVSFDSKEEKATFLVSIDTATVVSYVLGKYTVEGLQKEAYLFMSVTENLAKMSSIFNKYNTQAEEVNERAHNWIHGLEGQIIVPTETETKTEGDSTPAV